MIITCQCVSARQCCVGDVSFPWERPFFEGPSTTKPLDRSTPNFEKITTVLSSCYKPCFITIASRGSSAQYGEVAVASFFHFLLRLSSGTRRSIFHAYASNDVVCDKEVPFASLIDEKVFSRGISLPQNFKGTLHANRKSRTVFER
jgi:hypothetical protein